MEQLKKERIELLKDYLKRLGEGEALESVMAEFVEHFKDVEPTEIMKAEQEMIQSGIPVAEVKKLCDVHSALFHGRTTEEKIQGAERAVKAAMLREERDTITRKLVGEVGHPLHTFTRENEALELLIGKAREAIGQGEVTRELVERIREVAIHYAKKGDLLYPHLKVKYEISGPSDVMWTVDDEIRDELASILKYAPFVDKDDVIQMAPTEAERSRTLILTQTELPRFAAVIKRIEEMIYKEANILFPNCAANFTREEWVGIYHDAKDYANCFGVEPAVWELAERAQHVVEGASPTDEVIVMAGGHMTVAQLTAMLNTMPFEITFVDENNINCFFNEGPKDFKRPGMAIGREVFSCHPPKIETMVRKIIEDFRTGTFDQVPVWMEKNGKTMLVTYMAVRDRKNHYLGTLELVQDMTFAKNHFEK